MQEKIKKIPTKGIYLLPNLLTTASLFAAFYAIVVAMGDAFELAAIAIFIAMVTDSLDGRVARLTGTQSAFGAEYDSLSDMVSFGLAPALVVYSWSLFSLGTIGWLVSFLYTAATALRLARFNTQLNVADKRYFQGLACPAGAGVIASLVWFFHEYAVPGEQVNILVAIVTVLMAVLMVSNVRYYSFKDVDFKGKVPFFVVLLIVLIFVGISVNPPLILLVSFGVYAASGPSYSIYRKWKKRKSK